MPNKTEERVLSEVRDATASIIQYASVIYPDRDVRALALLYAAVGETARMIPEESEEMVHALILKNIEYAWEAALTTNKECRNAKA